MCHYRGEIFFALKPTLAPCGRGTDFASLRSKIRERVNCVLKGVGFPLSLPKLPNAISGYLSPTRGESLRCTTILSITPNQLKPPSGVRNAVTLGATRNLGFSAHKFKSHHLECLQYLQNIGSYQMPVFVLMIY